MSRDVALREYAGERAVAMLSDVLYTSQRETIRALLIAGIGLGIRRLQVPLAGHGQTAHLLLGAAALLVSLSTVAYGGAPEPASKQLAAPDTTTALTAHRAWPLAFAATVAMAALAAGAAGERWAGPGIALGRFAALLSGDRPLTRPSPHPGKALLALVPPLAFVGAFVRESALKADAARKLAECAAAARAQRFSQLRAIGAWAFGLLVDVPLRGRLRAVLARRRAVGTAAAARAAEAGRGGVARRAPFPSFRGARVGRAPPPPPS